VLAGKEAGNVIAQRRKQAVALLLASKRIEL
jgi:hypothetical protein